LTPRLTAIDLAQAAVVSLARELGIVTCYQIGFDDILSVIPTDLDRSLRRKFIAEIFRMINRNLDFSLDDPKLQSGRVLKDSILYRIASTQLIVSYHTDPKRRDIPAKSAWVLLNLRSVCTNIAQTLSMTQQIRGMHNMEASLFVSLKGLVRWSLDLMTLIFDDMIEIMRFCKGNFGRERILAYVHERNSVTLHILLCSTSRALLGMLGNLIRNFAMRVVKTQEKVRLSSRANDIRDSVELQQMEAMMGSELPFDLRLFEQLVAEVDGNVRTTYQAAQSSPPQRSFYEQGMLVDADIPEALSPVLQRLFGEIVPRLESQIDGVAIYTADTAWLGLGEDEEANKRAGRQQYDVLRKCAIPPNAKIRQCRKCGSVIENLADGHMAAWVQNAHKMCICLSHWIVA
jgi:mediator of RNA polymerase II transcription subunit 16